MQTTKQLMLLLKYQKAHLTKLNLKKNKKMMRDIRDKISAETQNMTFDELKAYIKQQLTDSKSKLVGQK